MSADPSTLTVAIDPRLDPWRVDIIRADAFFARARLLHQAGDLAEARRLRDIADAKYQAIDLDVEERDQ